MLAMYRVHPASVEEEGKEHQTTDQIEQKSFEIILVTLLFIYLLLCVNTDVTYSGW